MLDSRARFMNESIGDRESIRATKAEDGYPTAWRWATVASAASAACSACSGSTGAAVFRLFRGPADSSYSRSLAPALGSARQARRISSSVSHAGRGGERRPHTLASAHRGPQSSLLLHGSLPHSIDVALRRPVALRSGP